MGIRRKVHVPHLVHLRANSAGESLLSPEPSASADAEALLDSPVLLAVLLRCPDECPSDDRKRKDAYGGDRYPEEGAHYDSSRVNTGEVGGLADALDDLDQFLGAVALLAGEADELAGAGKNSPTFGCTGDVNASATPELQ